VYVYFTGVLFRVMDSTLHLSGWVSDLRQAGGFLRVLRFPPPIKLVQRLYGTMYSHAILTYIRRAVTQIFGFVCMFKLVSV
jgi:hypothetical protein